MMMIFCRISLAVGLAVFALPSGWADTVQTKGLASQESASTGAAHTEPESLGRFAREQWNLSEAEWTRYQTLMRGLRGSISPATLSPIEVLGIHAQTEPERKGYARRWAKLMHEDATRVLAFQAAYSEASREINPGGQIIDPNAGSQNTPIAFCG
jgi:hypothetical protein